MNQATSNINFQLNFWRFKIWDYLSRIKFKLIKFNEYYFLNSLFIGHKGKVEIGMDVAASEFWNPEKQVYDLNFKTANNDGSN